MRVREKISKSEVISCHNHFSFAFGAANSVGFDPSHASVSKQDAPASLKGSSTSGDDKKDSVTTAVESNFVFGSTKEAKKDPSIPATSFSFSSSTAEKKDGNVGSERKKNDSTEATSHALSASSAGLSFGTQPPVPATTVTTTKDPTKSAALSLPATPQSPKLSTKSKSVELSSKPSLEINPCPPITYQTQTLEQILNSFSSALEEDALEFLPTRRNV